MGTDIRLHEPPADESNKEDEPRVFRLTFEAIGDSAYKPHVRISRLVKLARRVLRLRTVKIEEIGGDAA